HFRPPRNTPDRELDRRPSCPTAPLSSEFDSRRRPDGLAHPNSVQNRRIAQRQRKSRPAERFSRAGPHSQKPDGGAFVDETHRSATSRHPLTFDWLASSKRTL